MDSTSAERLKEMEIEERGEEISDCKPSVMPSDDWRIALLLPKGNLS